MKSVEFIGNEDVSSEELAESIATVGTPRFLGLFRGLIYDYQVFNIYVLQVDLQRINRYYRARGYYQARVRAGRVSYSEDNRLVTVRVHIEEGPPVVVQGVTLHGLEGLEEGVVQAVHQAALDAGVRVGAKFDEERFEGSEEAVRRALTDRGYAFAEASRQARVDVHRNQAWVALTVEPGERKRFGRIAIRGLGTMPEGPVRRALDLKEGHLYSTNSIDGAERALMHLGVFSSAEIFPDLTNEEAPVVPLSVRVELARHRVVRLGVGAELSPLESNVHLLASWENRNFLGGLRRFNVEARPGVVLFPTRVPTFESPTDYLPKLRLRSRFAQPGLFEARTNGLVTLEYGLFPILLTSEVPPDAAILGYHELKTSFGADRVIRKLYASVAQNFQYNVPFTYRGDIDPALKPVLISYPSLLARLDFVNDRINPTRGVGSTTNLQVAGLGGDARDVRIEQEVRGYVPIARNLSLAGRAKVGFLFPFNYGDLAFDQGAALDPSIRAAWVQDAQVTFLRSLFSGGPTSNRGYPFRGVGPHGVLPFYTSLLPAFIGEVGADACVPGDLRARCLLPLGGFSLWEVSVELRYLIAGPLSAATFCDASDVTRRELRLTGNPHVSCGQGLRYETPVGPIRLDAAYRIPGLQVLSDPERIEGEPGENFGQPIAIWLGIGQAF